MRIRLVCCTALALAFGPGAGAVHAQPALEDLGYALGDTAAAVEVIEFGDYGCTTCADFWRESWPRVRNELIETGRVVWWHVPIAVGYRRGKEAANAAHCAAEQHGYWPMHDLLMDEQGEWMSAGGLGERFARMAAEARLDGAAFSACFDEGRWEGRTRDATRAARRGIRGLPTFFVNGRPVVGAVSYEFFLQFVEEAERAGGGGSGSKAPPRTGGS